MAIWSTPSGVEIVLHDSSFPPSNPRRDAALEGIEAWEGIIGSALEFQIGISSQEPLLGNGLNEVFLIAFGPGSTLWALTPNPPFLDSYPPYYMREVDIAVNSNGSAYWQTVDALVDTTYEVVPSNVSLQGIIAHEVGHLIGLAHCPNRLSIMTNIMWNGAYNHGHLHADDYNALRALYPRTGGPLATDLEASMWHAEQTFDNQNNLVSVGVRNTASLVTGAYFQPRVHVASGGAAAAQLTIENFGNGFQEIPRLSFFLSDDPVASPQTDSLYAVLVLAPIPPASGDQNNDPANQSSEFIPFPCVPSNRSAYIWYEIDHDGFLFEDREDNNRQFITHNGYPIRFDIDAALPGEPCAPDPGGGIVPGPPVGFSASDDRCIGCMLRWTPPSTGEPSKYLIKLGGATISEIAASGAACAGGQCSWIDWSALSVGVYPYSVVAANAYGASAEVADDGRVVTSDVPNPLNVVASTDRCDGVCITWQWPSGVAIPDAVRISWTGASATVPANQGSFCHSTHIGSIDYTVRGVRTSTQCASAGVAVSGLRLMPLYINTSPTLQSVSSTRCDGVRLQWSYVGSASADWRYEIYRDSTGVETGHAVGATASKSDSTFLDSVAAPGRSYWYRVRAISASSWTCPPTVFSPAMQGMRPSRSLIVRANVASAKASVAGVTVDLDAGGYRIGCESIAPGQAIALDTEPTQEIGGAHYCFDSWSDRGSRTHSITVQSDTIITLNLVPSGNGPTVYAPGVIIGSDLSDCRSPHVFQGDASAPSGLLIYPGAKLRFPKAGGQSPYAGLSVSNHLIATGVTFETVDSTESNVGSTAWKGIQIADPYFSQLYLSNCVIRNATTGVGMDAGGYVFAAQVDSSTFEKNTNDIVLTYINSSTTGKTLTLRGNYLKARNSVQVTGGQLASAATVTAAITGNTFAGALTNSKWLRINGGFTGQVNDNLFNMGNSGNIGIELYTQGQVPAVSLTGNRFQFGSTQNFALIAPDAPGHPYITAYNNNWNLSWSSEVEQSILHYKDTSTKAEVLFEPFTMPNGGGGGGGSGGCPFVLSRRSDGSYEIENSILGTSEGLPANGAFVRDAYPLDHAQTAEDGRVHLRIAELEAETDFLDRVSLDAYTLPEGSILGVEPNGTVIAVRPEPQLARIVAWSGRNAPFVSPIAPGNAYSGDAGDSLDLFIPPLDPGETARGRRFYISMIPKPAPAMPGTGGRIGVTVRTADGASGEQWTTTSPMIPRALWSTAIVPIDMPGSASGSRVRIVWNTQHALGWAGIAEVVEPIGRWSLPLRSASHSVGGDVLAEVASDGTGFARLDPGQSIDLAFEAGSVPVGARLVLSARGRYQLGGKTAEDIPLIGYADQNHPNPFNPQTTIRFGLARSGHARIAVFDISGRLVRILVDRDLPAGHHTATWDGTDASNRPVASGVYFYSVAAGDFTSRKRMVLIR